MPKLRDFAETDIYGVDFDADHESGLGFLIFENPDELRYPQFQIVKITDFLNYGLEWNEVCAKWKTLKNANFSFFKL